MWYTSSDHKSVRLIEHLGHYVNEVTDVFTINPKIVSFKCGDDCDAGYKRLHCLSNGRYCDMNANKEGKYAYSYMLENLFQYCIAKESSPSRQTQLGTNLEFSNYIEKYLRYMNTYCGDDINPFCRYTGAHYIDLGADERTLWEQADRCVNSTFTNSDSSNVDYFEDDNYVLRQMQEEWNNYGTHLFPSAVLNNITFRGAVNADSVFEAACSIPETLPSGCERFLTGTGRVEHIGNIRNMKISKKKEALMIIVAVLVCVNLVFFYYYRKNMQEEAARDVKIQVSSAVSQYVALSQISELNQPPAKTEYAQ